MTYVLIYWHEAALWFHCTKVTLRISTTLFKCSLQHADVNSIYYHRDGIYTLHIKWSVVFCETRQKNSSSAFLHEFDFPKVSVWQVLIWICPCSNLHVCMDPSYVFLICGWVQTLTTYQYRRQESEGHKGQQVKPLYSPGADVLLHTSMWLFWLQFLGHLMLFFQWCLAQF